jgi:peptidoglycan hydrolase-like protein with peptidoglycan-binding domain/ABC-type branched-subunit amino acid transport system substrate-binding protein
VRTRVVSRRTLWVLIAAGVVIASCSSDSDSAPDTTIGTENTTAATEAPVDSEPADTALTGDGLVLAAIAPSPGLLSTTFDAQQRGLGFAADDIATGGGVLDGPLTVSPLDTPLGSTQADVVPTAIDGGAQVLVGPTGSSGAADYRAAVETAGAISCSATASVPGITADQDAFGLFRTSMSDDIVVSFLANTIVDRRDAEAPDAPWKVAIVARSDDYGLAVGNGLALSLQARGLAPTVIDYNPRRVSFTGTASRVTSLAPDLTVIVSYEEGAPIVTELTRAGVAPASMIGLDSFFRPRIGTLAGPDGVAESVDGLTMVGTIGDRAFLQRLIADDPNAQVVGAAQAYDCAITFALATEAVADGSSASLSAAIIDVTGGGNTCTTYADCLDKLGAGEDIDYDGVSGNLGIDETGDPTFARFTTGTIVGGDIGNIETADVDVAALRAQAAAFAQAAFTTKLQQALTFLGFYSGPIDGLDSPELTAALAAFQASVGLPATGVFDSATDEALRAALGEYSMLLSTTTIDLQTLLTSLGYYSGPIDGIWSPDVTASIRALQRDLGVPESGVLDAATIRAIYEQGVIAGTPPPTTVPPTTTPEATLPATTVPPTTVPPTTAPETVPPTTAPPVPLPTDNLFETLQADPDFSIFVDLVLASGFDADIERLGLYTIFAPTNAAFGALSPADLEALRSDPGRLSELLGYHAAEGRYLVSQLAGTVETVNGASITIGVGTDGSVTVDGATIARPDILASNGVIQGLATLLAPPQVAVPLPGDG